MGLVGGDGGEGKTLMCVFLNCCLTGLCPPTSVSYTAEHFVPGHLPATLTGANVLLHKKSILMLFSFYSDMCSEFSPFWYRDKVWGHGQKPL